MIKKIILFSFLILFLNNCGYTPIYSKKSQDFQINTIETSGEVKVNKLLYNKLKVYSDNPNAQKSFNLNINSSSTKTTILPFLVIWVSADAKILGEGINP